MALHQDLHQQESLRRQTSTNQVKSTDYLTAHPGPEIVGLPRYRIGTPRLGLLTCLAGSYIAMHVATSTHTHGRGSSPEIDRLSLPTCKNLFIRSWCPVKMAGIPLVVIPQVHHNNSF